MADTAKISHAHPMRRIAVWASGVVLLLLVVCAVTLALRPALLARPAVYRVQIEPPEAALAATGRAVSIEGEGPARTVTVAEPDGRREVVLVATRRGYENLVHWLTPRPGDAETVDLRLRRLKEPEATPPPRQESVPPKLATPPSHSEAAARPEVAELPLQPPKDPAPSRPQTVAPQTAAPQASPNHQEIAFDLGHGVKLELVRIPAGEFLMGSPKSDNNALGDEKPQHRVQITRPFYLGKYLVTQEQWQAVMGSNPSGFKGPKNPVENVSWDDCQEFLGKLRKKFGAGRGKFQLPTESAMGVCLPGGEHNPLVLRRQRGGPGRLCVVQQEREKQNPPGGREEAQCLGAVRHARKRLGVVPGSVWGRLLRQFADEGSGGADARRVRLLPRRPGRQLGSRRQGLPFGQPQRRHAR